GPRAPFSVLCHRRRARPDHGRRSLAGPAETPARGRSPTGAGQARSQAGGAPDGEPAAEVLLEGQVGADRAADLEFQGVVPLAAGEGSERVERAALVEVDEGEAPAAGILEGDQGDQQVRAEAVRLQGRV